VPRARWNSDDSYWVMGDGIALWWGSPSGMWAGYFRLGERQQQGRTYFYFPRRTACFCWELIFYILLTLTASNFNLEDLNKPKLWKMKRIMRPKGKTITGTTQLRCHVKNGKFEHWAPRTRYCKNGKEHRTVGICEFSLTQSVLGFGTSAHGDRTRLKPNDPASLLRQFRCRWFGGKALQRAEVFARASRQGKAKLNNTGVYFWQSDLRRSN